jgi:hypothetical protein
MHGSQGGYNGNFIRIHAFKQMTMRNSMTFELELALSSSYLLMRVIFMVREKDLQDRVLVSPQSDIITV